MQLNVGLENNLEGRSLAWALDYPGCFAFGQDESEALVNMPRAFLNYRTWIAKHTEKSWLEDVDSFHVKLSEVWNTYFVNDEYETAATGYEVNSWFRHDWKPLTTEEVRRGLLLLRWSREELLLIVNELPIEKLNEQKPGERWPVIGIIKHIASAEWWYLDRLGLAGTERKKLPEDVSERLAVIRKRLEIALPSLVGLKLVQGKDGEFWSPRKLLRRTLWHERDHIEHILKLVVG